MTDISASGENAAALYLQRLAQQAKDSAEAERLRREAASVESFDQVQDALAEGQRNSADPASTSVLKRIEIAYGSTPLAPSSVFRKDPAGRVQLLTLPPINRLPMGPKPWTTGLFARMVKGVQLRRGKVSPWRSKRESSERPARPRWRIVGSIRRWILLLLVIAQSALAVTYMATILPNHGSTVLEMTNMVFFAVLFAWVSSGFWTALMGFYQLLTGRDRYSINAKSIPDDAPIAAEAKTALLMPIFNEDVNRVFAGLKATYLSLKDAGQLDHFDIYICSDSADPDTCVAEQTAWLRLCREVDGFDNIFYRRRRRRVKRKSGNLDDWLRRYGADYRYMLVLDADSVMTSACLTRLVQLMEANPNAGLIQSAPVAAGATNLYARLQQFASKVYGPLFTAGLHFWQLGESHYWGHNAIIRVDPFMRYCSLAPLPGKGSLSGEILSHDFVEAALMRRAGYGVWIAYDLPGSYEELPPNLLEELQRDQRWCHGNLMNVRLLFVKGMHPVHRAVFVTGVMSYLSAPLWFIFLLLSTAMLAVSSFSAPQYFTQPMQLFPSWPEWHPWRAVGLFSTTLTLLFLPKILSVLLIACKGAEQYGGRLRLFVSMVIESLFSMLLAPVRMLFHTKFVFGALLGIKAKWKSPDRAGGETSWGDAAKRHMGQTILGIVWILVVLWLDPRFLMWLSPIVGALVLSIPVSVISSRVNLGIGARKRRLFLTPDEAHPARVLRRTWKFNHIGRERGLGPSFVDSVVAPVANAVACAMGFARHRESELLDARRQEIVRQALAAGPERFPAPLKVAVLDDPVMLSRLHYVVWSRRDKYPSWVNAADLESAAIKP
ncbi:glucans biosynthesis glucosyltransferase MdoH [Carnimonas bestiolae]|uniref:glucans biosynthesis glucosyltransferase MdoH n=1 Tax=Carnimonas bestiolae TaxID=3402172 RepID=UPI003EDC3824